MLKVVFAFLIVLVVTNCSQKSELSLAFNCSHKNGENDLKFLDDIHKNYRISFPNTWKSSLYFDEFQSDIYLADTTKSLTASYILTLSNKKGELIIDQVLIENLVNSIQKENLNLVKTDSILFLNTQSYYVRASGIKNNFNYQLINILKPSQGSFFDIKIELYGDKDIENRICDAIYYVNHLQELK